MRTAIVALSALACASTSLAFMPVTMQAQPKAGQLGKQKSPATLTSSAPRLGLPSLQAATSSFFDILPKGLDFGPKKGGASIGVKKTVVVTGASSGLGKATVKALAKRGGYFIICAVRDVEKMKQVAQELGLENGSYKIMELNLQSFDSVRDFAKKLKAVKGPKPLDSLICNAAVYLPARSVPDFTPDGFEESLQVNHLSHFLLISLLIEDMKKSKDPRVTIVGSITGNTNTIGGAFVFPRASLGKLEGMAKGGQKPVAMIDGKPFNGAKAYKDSKVCNMMTARELHNRYHASTGITFNTMYPGCIAETPLFREKRQWFRTIFPLFMKYVTGGYVGEEEAGERLARTIYDPICKESGNYWSWNGNAQQVGYFDPAKKQVVGAGGSGGSIFKNTVSNEVLDEKKAQLMWDYSTQITGAVWPKAK